MSEKMTKHTMLLRAGDFARLQEAFSPPGAGPTIRHIVSRYVDALDAKISNTVEQLTLKGLFDE